MTDEALLRFRDRAERRAKEDPEGYRREVARLALVGCGLLVTLHLVFVVPGLLVMLDSSEAVSDRLLRSLISAVWLALGLRVVLFRLPEPEGRRLDRGEAPQLFEEIDTVARRFDAAPPDTIKLDPQVGASIACIPRFGLFGFSRRVLVLGLPAMHALSADEFRAVLAHELAHLSKRHLRTGNWVFRVRMTWEMLYDQTRTQPGVVATVQRHLTEWFASRFVAYSSALCVWHEYEADAVSARLYGAETGARALIAVHALEFLLDRTFRRELWKAAASSPRPPGDAVSGLIESLQRLEPEQLRRAQTEVMQACSEVDDTHPSLADRLDELGVRPDWSGPASPSSAEHFLGESLAGLTRELDRSWAVAAEEQWSRLHARLGTMTKAKQNLVSLAARRELDPRELFELGRALEELGNADSARSHYERAAAAGFAPAVLALGRQRLADDDESGISLIERAMAEDESLRPEGCELLYRTAIRRGRADQVRRHWVQSRHAMRQWDRAGREREAVRRSDTFSEHGLPEHLLDAWRDVFRRRRHVKRVWVARKDVQRMRSAPAFVMIVRLTGFFRVPGEILGQLGEELETEGTLTLLDHSRNRSTLRRMRHVAGRPIYRRARREKVRRRREPSTA